MSEILVASGEKLSLDQSKIQFNGHAIEVRINAEDPQTLAPSPGKITFYLPAGGVRRLRVRFGGVPGLLDPRPITASAK